MYRIPLLMYIAFYLNLNQPCLHINPRLKYFATICMINRFSLLQQVKLLSIFKSRTILSSIMFGPLLSLVHLILFTIDHFYPLSNTFLPFTKHIALRHRAETNLAYCLSPHFLKDNVSLQTLQTYSFQLSFTNKQKPGQRKISPCR